MHDTSTPRTTICYALKRTSNHFACGYGYAHVYQSAFPTHLSSPDEPIQKIRVTEDDAAPADAYWAWWSNEKQKFVWVYPTRAILGMVFPGGLDFEIRRGNGTTHLVKIENLGTFTVEEAKTAEWTP